MPKRAMEILTETMYYVLMALSTGPMCGTDIAAWISRRTAGRIEIGPATLYTILGKFEKERYITETEVSGRKRTYCISGRGLDAYRNEVERLRSCVSDAEQTWRGGA